MNITLQTDMNINIVNTMCLTLILKHSANTPEIVFRNVKTHSDAMRVYEWNN